MYDGQLVRTTNGKWMTKPPSRCPNYTGTIEPNGRVSGTTVNNAGVSNSWLETGGAWTCAAWGFGPSQP